ncbi:hypothetical protein GIB67_031249 [Kingdonia uniflora]|uniref:Uncharacterized protein n=1 Tax=Kingdonia uniflora TaxID=39325 RepID=A0A7J7NKK7_9MAGN|nr:hypothetical protein GIB67_031249 [Kingdonia uniflora]
MTKVEGTKVFLYQTNDSANELEGRDVEQKVTSIYLTLEAVQGSARAMSLATLKLFMKEVNLRLKKGCKLTRSIIPLHIWHYAGIAKLASAIGNPIYFYNATEEFREKRYATLPFMIYAWRTVLWELSNWKNALLGISHFLGYLGKFVLAVVFHYIGDPVTSLIRCIETVLYTIRSIYSGIVASTPVPELSMIIMLTSVVLAIAETAVPNSVNSQPYLLTMAGVVGFIAVRGSIPEPFFWMILAGLFCYSRFVQKKNGVSSALPVAAVLSAVGALWVRLLVMSSYLALSICHHSKKLSEENTEVEIADVRRRVPLPLFGAGLAIGVHVAAKWLRFRHLTWMIA